MLTAWILGSLFFVFILGFVLYVLTRNDSEPEISRPEVKLTFPDHANPTGESDGKYRFSRDYQVVFSPQAFVHYPFGLRVVITPAKVSDSTPAVAGLHSNGKHPFQESYYHNWPQVVTEDSQLVVQSGHLEFETTEVEPVIRVELRCDGRAFQEISTVQEQIVKRDKDTIYSFWLTPVEAQSGLLTVVISYATEMTTDGRGEMPSANHNRSDFELVAILLAISVTHFPIRLR